MLGVDNPYRSPRWTTQRDGRPSAMDETHTHGVLSHTLTCSWRARWTAHSASSALRR
jgi:hypothetical protein